MKSASMREKASRINGSSAWQAAPVRGAAGGSLSIGLDLYDRSQNPNTSISGGASAFPVQDRILTLSSGSARQPAGSTG